MADTPEKKVKRRVTELLKASGAYYFYPVMSGFGSAGIPDLVACHHGMFIGIECKAGKGKPTPLQDQNLTRITQAGGYALVINEENLDVLKILLETITANRGQ